MNEEQDIKNIIQMLYYTVKTFDCGISKEDIDKLDRLQQKNTSLNDENEELKEQNIALSTTMDAMLRDINKLKDKDEKISETIAHINETGMICACGQDSYEKLQNDILEILERNKEN